MFESETLELEEMFGDLKKNDEDVTCNYRKNNGKPKGQIIVLIIANYGNRTRLDCHSTKFHLL